MNYYAGPGRGEGGGGGGEGAGGRACNRRHIRYERTELGSSKCFSSFQKMEAPIAYLVPVLLFSCL